MIYIKSSVGVEICGEDLRMAVLQSNLSTGVFTSFKRIPAYRTRDKEEIRKEINHFFKSQRLSKDNIVLGLPRKDIILRYLDLPAEVSDNLKQVVLYQVQSFEPTEEDKFYFDYAPLKGAHDAKRLIVLLIMIRKNTLDGYLDVLRELGIKPAAVVCSSVALANLLLQETKAQEKKTCILADLKPGGMEVIALRDGALLHTRSAERGEGMAWKELFLRELEAAAAKIRLDPEEEIDDVVLTGEFAGEAQPEIQEALGECSLIRRYIHFETPVQNHTSAEEASVALGLAYSGIARRPALRVNLLPMTLRTQQTRWAYVPTIVLGVSILVLLVGMFFRDPIQERILMRRLDQESQNLRPRVARIQSIVNESESLEKQISYLEGLVRKRDMNLEILRELTTILPTDTFLNVYINKEGVIQISGSSGNAPDLIPKLEKSPLLMNVIQQGTIFKDAQTGKDRFNFQAKLER